MNSFEWKPQNGKFGFIEYYKDEADKVRRIANIQKGFKEPIVIVKESQNVYYKAL